MSSTATVAAELATPSRPRTGRVGIAGEHRQHEQGGQAQERRAVADHVLDRRAAAERDERQ